jgi:hypothetical protein
LMEVMSSTLRETGASAEVKKTAHRFFNFSERPSHLLSLFSRKHTRAFLSALLAPHYLHQIPLFSWPLIWCNFNLYTYHIPVDMNNNFIIIYLALASFVLEILTCRVTTFSSYAAVTSS